MGKKAAAFFPFRARGYTFAIDFPIRHDTAALIRKLDAMVLDAGGRIYLGKDSYIDAATFRAVYPAAQGWLQTKAKVDPENAFTSNLGRRIGLS